MVPIARLERTIRPEDLAPPPGTVLGEGDLARNFGLDDAPSRSGRHGGHLFIVVDRPKMLVAPDRVRFVVADPRPSETAFVLARRDDGTFRYLGVGRGTEEHGVWAIPEVDFATWRAWGEGRTTSRRLPDGSLSRAQVAADALLAMPEGDRAIAHPDGRRARVLGSAERGGLRVDGGDGGFAERTVSLTDIAWVIVADDDVREHGGVLDEARVNRLRYLEGTPKGSTRWIDTGWAIAAWNRAKPLVRDPAGEPGVLRKVRDDEGRILDASFRVEPVGDALTVVLESRGGTRGSKDERNTDYDRGLRLILSRLKKRAVRITDVLVESRDTLSLPPDQRRVALPTGYPVIIEDEDSLKRALSAGQAKVGRAPGAKGAGNRTKRIRIFVDGRGTAARELAETLERG